MLLLVNGVLLLICASLIGINWKTSSVQSSEKFSNFQYTYLFVYLCMTLSDWLQGAYVYVLYESYGYGIDVISKLFILGFFSSMIFGTVVGSFSDRIGRKTVCLIFVVMYIISCLTKHSSDLYILLFGRLTGGIATSILYSSFESWMICEHNNRSFDASWISDTFYKQTFANGIIAILSGYLSNFLYEITGKSAVAPFDFAIVCLVIGGAIMWMNWNENYGDTQGSWNSNFSKGLEVMKNDKKVLCVAISQSFFEAAMYIFVLMWTPTLKSTWNSSDPLDIGYVFASFMISVMIGSSIFKMVYKKEGAHQPIYTRVEFILFLVFILGTISFIIPIISDSFLLILCSFLMFELCVGIFWPAISTLKSIYIPEDVRSTVMNYIRIPTNFLVVISLYFVDSIPQFHVCSGLVIVSLFSQAYLVSMASEESQAREV